MKYDFCKNVERDILQIIKKEKLKMKRKEIRDTLATKSAPEAKGDRSIEYVAGNSKTFAPVGRGFPAKEGLIITAIT